MGTDTNRQFNLLSWLVSSWGCLVQRNSQRSGSLPWRQISGGVCPSAGTALALSNYNGNISKCSIKWTARGGAGGDAGQVGQQPVSGVKLREGNPSRDLTAKMAQMGLQTSQGASTRPREVRQHPASRQPGIHCSLQPPALHKNHRIAE